MSITLKRFVTGPINTNTYIVQNESNDCLIVDPSSGCDEVIAFLLDKQLQPQGIIITHGHFDHIVGIPEIVARFPSVVTYIHPAERSTLTNPMHSMSIMAGVSFYYNGVVRDIEEGPFTIGSFIGRVFVIPGHSPGGCALHIDNYLLCGDILFPGSVGRTDFPGGNQASIIAGIRSKLLTLADETIVCPGHGGRTTIGRERRLNPYL
jgi:glyoxylase-like metal-dependent hydrolase (beta-lactamase superfamily II)